MNSLTTVGGKVIDTEELSSMHERLSRSGTVTQKISGGAGIKGVRGRGTQVKGNSIVGSPRSQLDDRLSSRRSTSSSPGGKVDISSSTSKPKLGRHASAPSAIATSNERNSSNNESIHSSVTSPRLAHLSSPRLPPRSPPFRKKVSIQSTSSSTPPPATADLAGSTTTAANANTSTPINSQIITSLTRLSLQESFNKSSYFRGVFARGIDKVKKYDEMIGTVDEALTLCFDVSDDMKKVIAAKVHADELMSSPIMASPGGNGGELQTVNAKMIGSNNTSKPWASSPRMNKKPWDSSSNRKLKPWEEPFSKRRPSVQEYMQQIEARIHRTYSNGTTDSSTNRSPFDEALVSPRLVRRKAINQKETMSSLSSLSPRNNSQEVQEVNDGTPAQPSDQLFSGSEHLVKGLELIADNKRMTLELEQNKTELSRQEAEIEAFKVAMSEAETAVKTLEESVRELNEAIAAKDELIVELETEAKEGEVASSEKQMAQQEQVKELGSAVSQLNLLVKEMEAESKEADVRLAEALQKCSESEAALKQLQLTMAKNEEEHAKLVQEMEKEKDELVEELEALKETMASSLENTTKQMDGVVKEKDKLIYTLSAKIEMLESTLEDVKEKKLEIDISAANKEKELNEKILDLATTLTEKDEKMAELQKEVDDLKKKSSKIGKRAGDKDERRHTAPTKSRPWERPDDLSYRTRSSFGSDGSSRRRQLSSSNQRGRDNEDTRVARLNKKAGSSFPPQRVRYETPEPYEEEGRDDGYGYSYPERDAALFSPVDDDSYVYRNH
jgi:hypothetical protein